MIYVYRVPILQGTVGNAIGSFFLTAAVAALAKGDLSLGIGAGCFALTATYVDSVARASIESLTGNSLQDTGTTSLILRTVVIASLAYCTGPALGVTISLTKAVALSALSLLASWLIRSMTNLMPEWNARRASLYLIF